MKIKKLFLNPLFLSMATASYTCVSCDTGPKYYSQFSAYYDPANIILKGIELYVWKDDSEWFSGLLPGTNRTKTVDEIIALQDNPCPISLMNEIIHTYPDCYFDVIHLFIVSKPPLESELLHLPQRDMEEYKYLVDYFGLKTYS